MITHLKGQLAESSPGHVIIDVQGVGYEVLIPSSSFAKLPAPGQSIQLLTHFIVREDAQLIFGFYTREERELFRLLVGAVSGIGPKIALNVLSSMTPSDFVSSVKGADTKPLSQISGLGKKTAERIVVELKDKIASIPFLQALATPTSSPKSDPIAEDAIAALTQLGYKPSEAATRVAGAQKMLGPKAGLDELIKASLSPHS